MPNFKKIDVIKSLEKKGFQGGRNTKHNFYVFVYDNKVTSINTHLSNNNEDIRDPLSHLMAKQLHLTNPQFKDLIECPLSQEEYIKILKEKGIIS